MGLDVYAEVSLSYGSAIDCIGLKHNNFLIGVELKTSNTAKLLKQTLRTKKYCHYTFAATPVKPDKKYLHQLKRAGVGFILIKENKIDMELSPKLSKPKKNVILHPAYKHNIGGISNKDAKNKKTIYQQLYSDVHAYLIARNSVAVPTKKVIAWIRSYCIGKVTKHRLNKIIQTSPDLYEYNGFVMYLKDYIRHTPFELREYADKAIKEYRNDGIQS